MWTAVLNSLFGCSHRRITFPLTPRRKVGHSAGHAGAPYVVCLKCGAEFEYDWQAMRVHKPVNMLIPTRVEETSLPT